MGDIADALVPRGKGLVCRWVDGRVILLTTPTETNSGRETRARVVFASLRLSSLCVFVYIYAREKHSGIPDNTSAFSL